MKKAISLLLALVLCLSLCACGGGNSEDADLNETAKALPIIGTWECLGDQKVVINGDTAAGTQLIIREDKTGIITSGEQSVALTWNYDAATRTVIMYSAEDPSEVETFVYLEVINSLSNDWYGLFTHVES